MFKVKFSKKALNYINEQQKLFLQDNSDDELVIAIFFHSASNWTIAFCGNVVELVKRQDVLEDGHFIEYMDNIQKPYIKVFIEEEIIPELILKDEVLVDAALGEVSGEKIAMFFIKKKDNVYG